jgi:hypothetical protein
LWRLAVSAIPATIRRFSQSQAAARNTKGSLMRLSRVVLLISLFALVAAPTALALRFTDASFFTPVGYTGQPYQHKFDGAAGCGPDPNVPGSGLPYQFRVLGGTLPPGLVLDKNGLLHGIPTQTGDWSFWVELSDEDPPSADWCVPKKAERQFTVKILAGLNIQQNSLSPRAAFLNQPYNFQLTAEGGGTQTWSLVSGALPHGITLSSGGLLSGTPTATGDFTFKIQVTDGNRKDEETYALSVVEPLRITTKPAAPAAEVGLPFQLALTATGGRAPYTWSAAGLPAGFTLDPATGVISGLPSVASSAVVKVTVTDALGLTTTVNFRFPVAAKLAIKKKLLPTAKVGARYNGRFTAIGGIGPFKWTFLGTVSKRASAGLKLNAKRSAGSLPAGIRLNTKTGQLSGIPTKAGTYRLRVQVTDKLRVKSTAVFVLKVLPKGAR